MKEHLTPISAALYARVSSDRQDVDLSISAQLRALRDYAKKNGYVVAREYVDEAESGRIADRPQFTKMLDAAAKPNAPFKEILVWKFSRFTRKREHAVAFKSMLRRRGISNCCDCQVNTGFQGACCLTMALRIVSSLRMQAVMATFFGLPASTRRV